MIVYKDYILGLKTEMLKKDIMQKDLSEKTGISLTTINQILNCRTSRLATLLKIEEVIKEWN